MKKLIIWLKSKHFEWSKLFCTLTALFFALFGLWGTIKYYSLMKLAIMEQSTVVPDATLPITYVTVVVGALFSYLLYNSFLKNSKNKYHIDEPQLPDGVSEEEEINGEDDLGLN